MLPNDWAAAKRALPPRLPFVLGIGVTGHRIAALPEGEVGTIVERIRAVLAEVKACALDLHRREAAHFADCAPRLLFVSPLADGADQIAAEIALELGFELHAILPFERGIYRTTLHESGLARFDDLLGKATCVLELPGSLEAEHDAFVMAGRATVAHCDLLLAVWDGHPPRGRGGTGEVVELALTRGTPLVHVPVGADKTVGLRWSAFDPSVVTQRTDTPVERSFTTAHVAQVLNALLSPPPDAHERAFIDTFQGERMRRWKARLEYPLLLAATGVSRFGAQAWRGDISAAYIREDWERYCSGCWDPSGLSNPLAPLEQWYSWSDSLASHFAQAHRSGHVFNFVLAAVAVLLALAALPFPHLKPYLAATEIVVILSILINTKIGTGQQWHRRWLDYRQLAERLRPMRSLKLLGIAAPDPPGTQANPVPRRWVDWYAAGVWRAVGFPNGRIRASQSAAFAEAVAAHELWPQIEYHHRAARQVEQLDHRLEVVGLLVFATTLLTLVGLLAAIFIDHHWALDHAKWFTIVTAGLPAIGTALFGIRVQGDYAGTAVRSEQTAIVLAQVADRLEIEGPDLSRTADLVEQAARLMTADLDDWALLNRQHDLSVG
ncbi:hypothetical protein H8M03_09120 [Sphingomonas sabuli]|uniref:SMODS and SLOG-associating 2TM effector domain-containing protein n=1 Tax=Sphingomonas sabuli TaxID=2764186 RepID=A0A7G9L0N2_9SPHN|nr:DUF4231 domain-containing protein [Sphingomonas sabuli]QNM82181.1 hypothetical protein H8M03_09120 [Sphingomonas sabuli]